MHRNEGTTMKRWMRITRRTGAALAAATLTLLLTGDGGVGAVPPGIDPLDVLSLKVRANAIVLLDSSGSMRDRTDFVGFAAANAAAGQAAGDERSSKMYGAKQVLKKIIKDNEAAVSFQFGRYEQDQASLIPGSGVTYMYTCQTSGAVAPEVNCSDSAADQGWDFTNSGVRFRRGTGDEYTAGGVKTIFLYATDSDATSPFSGYRLNTRFNLQNSTSTLCATATTAIGPWAPNTGTDPVTNRAMSENWNLPNTPAANPSGGTYNPNPNGPPYIEVSKLNNSCNASAGEKFYFRGVLWNAGNNISVVCGGFASQVALQGCTVNSQYSLIGPYLKPEVVPGTTEGDITTSGNTGGNSIKASGPTPIAESLIDIKQAFDTSIWGGSPPTGGISGLTVKPNTFVIVVTDGDDSCRDSTNFDTTTLDNNALRAAHKAQLLYAGVTADPESKVKVFFVAFGGAVLADRANWIAWGGSGMALPTTGSGAAQRWTNVPTTADRAACATCQDAFVASNVTDLSNALQAAIDQGQSTGTFSDQQSITESIFEYAAVAGGTPVPDSLDPTTRYNNTIPVLLQSTFVMPTFEGHLKAFRNNAGASLELWDAGTKLAQKVQTAMGTSATSNYRFDQLHANATDATIAASSALIKRRIYTTTRAGVSSFLDGTAASIVGNLTASTYFQPAEQTTLWPPTTAIDPAAAATAGSLDTALGLTSANYPTVLDFKLKFGACTASPSGGSPAGTLPATCADTDGPATASWQTARKEARQIVLAYMAGASLYKDTASRAIRTSAAPLNALQFRARNSVLAESTLAAPGVIAPPLQAAPQAHNAEYTLYRDGPKNGSLAVDGIVRGFGLRNPDKDGNASSASNTTLKPSMTVVYHATNGMLHAFRAGPNCGTPGASPFLYTGCTETGGEELWGFVPYDQLNKLRLMLTTPSISNHQYMLAAPVRFADVFVPGTFSYTISGAPVSGAGVWRTVLLFGRGIGGKHLTALDVTTPGPFTRSSLAANPPIHLWTRGNPDTQDLSAACANAVNNNKKNNAAGAADCAAYQGMGETWSVPAISFVTAADNTTARSGSAGIEFVAYLGSGFSTVASEGSTFYTLDVVNGDVIASNNVGDRAAMGFENALVASAAAYQPSQLVSGFVGHPASAKTERVYIGDVHGRLWRFMASSPGTSLLFADLGATQPIGNAVSLLKYQGTQATAKPHIFVETGNDNRVSTTGNIFKMYGLRDDDNASPPGGSPVAPGVATVLFRNDFLAGYRGVVQPATAYNGATPPSGRVFYVGAKFNPPSAAPSPPPCASSFDSILFAFGAESGGAAYDFGGSGSVTLTGQRVQSVRVSGGQLVLDRGLQAQNPPPPPAPPAVNPAAPAPQANVFLGTAMGPNAPAPYSQGNPIPGVVPYRMGSMVCR